MPSESRAVFFFTVVLWARYISVYYGGHFWLNPTMANFCSHHHIMIIEQSAGEGDWVSSPAPWDPGRMDPGSCETQAWNRSASAEWKCSKLKSGGGCSSCSDWSVVEKSKQNFLITNAQCFPWIKPRLRNIPGSLNCYVRPLQCIDLRSKPPHLNWTVMR